MTILTGCSGRGVSRVIAAIGLGLMAGLVLSADTARAASRESVPDFGPNVMVFNPSMPMAAIQQQIDKVYAVQQHNEFGPERNALLFLPGEYKVDVPIGFYTEVIGLGATPDAVHIYGQCAFGCEPGARQCYLHLLARGGGTSR